MAGQGTGRGGLDETMAEFVRRRRRDVESFGHDAEAAVREAYGRAIRDGEDLVLKTSSDVTRYGADLLAQKRPTQAKAAVPKPPAQVRKGTSQSLPGATRVGPPPSPQWWDSGPIKDGVGAIAKDVGIVGGVLRGGVHAVEGLVEGGTFLNRLMSPTDIILSPPGQSAAAQTVRAGVGIANYVRQGIADPRRVVDDVKAKGHQMRIDLDPTATPIEATLGGELRRNFNIGMNQGELAFDVGSLVVGGPLAKGVKEAGLLSKAKSYDKLIAQGKSPAFADYFSEPYVGAGHHAIVPQRFTFPKVLGGGSLPKKWLNSPFNVLAPEGIARAEMYERHFKVDPYYKGAKVPLEFKAEGWSGKKLGLTKYGLPGRIWHGTPAPFKAHVGGFGAAAGGVMYVDPSVEE